MFPSSNRGEDSRLLLTKHEMPIGTGAKAFTNSLNAIAGQLLLVCKEDHHVARGKAQAYIHPDHAALMALMDRYYT